MEFANDVQKETYEKVKVWVRELFGEMAGAQDSHPSFYLRMGSAVVNIQVLPRRDDDAIVNIVSYVVQDVEMTPDLMMFLLNMNSKVILGAFGVDKDGDIFFDYTIPAYNCNKEILKHAAMAVLTTADEYDDIIVSKWGGQRAMD